MTGAADAGDGHRAAAGGVGRRASLSVGPVQVSGRPSGTVSIKVPVSLKADAIGEREEFQRDLLVGPLGFGR